MFRRFSIALLVILQLHSLLAQQSAPPLSAAAQKIKDQVSQIGVGNKLTVRKIDGTEYHGVLQAVESQTFSMQEVDLKAAETVPYREVKKVYKDYRRKNLITGRRATPKPHWVGIVVVTAVFVSLLLIAAVELRKS